MSLLRLTGRVVRVETKSGTKTDPATGEMRPWELDVAKVLVAEQDIVEVSVFKREDSISLSVGEVVDLAVEVSLRNNRLSIGVEKTWEDALPQSAPAARTRVRAAS